jgi:hypothetical protein
MTFVSYVTHVRLSHALRLLRESSLVIAEVAGRVDFPIKAISIASLSLLDRLKRRSQEDIGHFVLKMIIILSAAWRQS